MISELIGQAAFKRRRKDIANKKKVCLKKFVADCGRHIVIEDKNGNLLPGFSTRNNKIIIS